MKDVKKILVVDDAMFMRSTLKQILIPAGYDVIGEAENGEEAFELYKKRKPDLVTMDITMPEVDGIQGLKLIREFDPKSRIIMCSSMGQQDLVVEAIRLGALDFLVKPFKPERVLQSIARYINK